MKKYFYYVGLSLSVLMLAICLNVTTSCEGPAGEPGADANESCIQCHNDETTVLSRQIQAANSVHLTGGNFERNSTSCAPCHTHEGFLETMEAGTTTTAASINNPTPPNCRTCHNIHIEYDSTDFALRYTDPVELQANDETIDLGDANLCANCHQARPLSPAVEVGGADVTITNYRWGPHHGPQSAIIWGTVGYEIAGSKSYGTAGSGVHVNAGCNTCHMAEAYGNQAGGHTFRMSYLYHGDTEENLAACESCHPTIESFDKSNIITNTKILVDSLGSMLFAAGLIDEDGYIVPGTYTADEAGVVLNYLLVEEDKSDGIHNPAYVTALLTNSIESLQ